MAVDSRTRQILWIKKGGHFCDLELAFARFSSNEES
jgi:hypothetical protein